LLPKEITNSPIVSQESTVSTVVGLSYSF